MSGLPLHPALVHLPLGLAVIVPLVAIGLALALAWRLVPRRTWAIVVALQALLVGGGFVAMSTGESDEERVEGAVAEPALESHEEAAEVFVWSAAGVLVVAALGLVLRGPRASLVATASAAVLSLGVAGLALRTGHAGGELVYTHGAASAWVPADGAVAPARAHTSREDD